MQCACVISSAASPLYKIFPHYFINGTIFEKKKNVTKHKMCVSNFSAHMSEIFFILRRNERVVFGNVHRSSCTVPLFFSDFNETLIFSTDFEKSSNTKFHENPPSGSRAVPCGRIDGRTDGYDEASSCPSQFCESAKNDTKTLKYKGYINTVWSQVLV